MSWFRRKAVEPGPITAWAVVTELPDGKTVTCSEQQHTTKGH